MIKGILSTLAAVVILVLATVVIHEAGHFTAGTIFECKDIEITLVDENMETYTSMKCEGIGNNEFQAIAAGGLLFILPLSAAVFYLGRRAYSVIIFGFNLVISSADFAYIMPEAAAYLTLAAGAISVIYGESLLLNRYILDKTIPLPKE